MTDCPRCSRYLDVVDPDHFTCSCEDHAMPWIWPLIVIGPLLLLTAWLIAGLRDAYAAGRRRHEAAQQRRAMDEAGL